MTRQLRALLELTRVSHERPIGEVLQAVADVVQRVVGFTTVVVNVYRPAWDDYQVVLVHGPDANREALLHTMNSREAWEDNILQAAHERVPGAFFLDADNPDAWDPLDSFYVPDILELGDEPDRWRPDDGLFVALRAANGTMLGVLSLDVPSSGRRPTDEDLEILVAVANHAALAFERAQYAAEAERHRRTLAHLLEASARLATHTTVDGVVDQVRTDAVAALGFETVTVHRVVDEELQVCASGTEGGEVIDLARPWSFLGDGLEHGYALVKGADIITAALPSRCNGRGPHAWDDHRLLVPLQERSGRLAGVLVFDNPVDRLLPDVPRCQALRLLADNTVAVLESVNRQSVLEYLAGHDPLTGVRNRRDLHTALDTLADQPGGVSVLLCDLDHFKEINDRYGHHVGDQVLERFGTLLRRQARTEDVPVRVGGEEFCLVMPRVDTRGAKIAAERLRAATANAMTDLAPGLTVSIGTATSGPDSTNADQLLAAADQALYAAKAAGRNQTHSANTTPPAGRAHLSVRVDKP